VRWSDPRSIVLVLSNRDLNQVTWDRYADMPGDRERGTASYRDADTETQLAICGAFAATRLSGGTWDQLSVAHAFAVVMRAVLAAFYSHPWAWNEIGFGGPAYPRGYMRTGIGRKEPWESDDEFPLVPVADVRERIEGPG